VPRTLQIGLENAKQAEKEADEFAAELLLPAREIAPQ
jgi:Zn-dependent peptidase ImmA (M78 family)